MKNVAWVIAGIAAGVIFVFGVGILTIERIGLKGGAVFDLRNELVAVTDPGPGLLQLLAIAVGSALVAGVLTVGVGTRSRLARLLVRGSFAATTTLLIATSLSLLAGGYTQNGLTTGITPGWNGWIEEGGSNSVVHLVLLVVVAVMWMHRDSVPDSTTTEATEAEA